jgi:hypothetical protein
MSMQPLYTTLKINNEIELCEIAGHECKQAVERALLQKRISYYVRWLKPSLFSRRKDVCIICINDNVREEAENAVRAVCDETGFDVRFLMKRSKADYL